MLELNDITKNFNSHVVLQCTKLSSKLPILLSYRIHM